MNEQLQACSLDDIVAVEAKADSESTVGWRSRRILKLVALYLTMVCVSTVAIYLLEHASIFNAFRTALVAAIGKTVAANWVSGIFDCA